MNAKLRLPNRVPLFAVTILFGLMGVFPAIAAAQSVSQSSSLKIVPADSSFYFSTLNNRTKLEAVLESRAFAELSATPIAERIISAFQEGFEEGSNQSFADFQLQMKDLLGDDQYEDLIALTTDLVSNEIFVYGGDGHAELMEIYGRLNATMREILAETDVGDPAEATFEVLQEFAERLDDADLSAVKLPDTVIGFTLTDPDNAARHLELVHAFLLFGLTGGDVPLPLRRGFAQKTIGEASFLTLSLDGSILPWDELTGELDNAAPELREIVEKYIDHVSQMTLVIAVGVVDDFLLVSMGDSLEHLEALGEGDLLVDRAEFAAVRQHDSETFAQMGYVSERLMTSLFGGSWEDILFDLTWQLRSGLADMPLGDEFYDDLSGDLQKLGSQLDEISPTPGAWMAFSYLTDRGIEGYSYSWAENVPLDGSKTLSILDHIGGEPAFFAAGRSVYRPQAYQDLRDWVTRVDWYADKYGPDLVGPDEFAQYATLRDLMEPYLKRIDEATANQLIPSLADGQSAIVFDLKNASRQWAPDMPRATVPLPIPEIGIVCGINDREAFVQGVSEYYDVAREILEMLMAMAGDDIPQELYIPEPQYRSLTDGDMYYLTLAELEAFGLDKMFLPNMAVTDSVAIFSLSQTHSERLLKATELPDDGPFAQRTKPLAAAMGINHVVMVDALEAWVAYAGQMGAFDALDIDEEGFSITGAELLESLETLFAVARCVRGYQAVTYQEDGAMVTRFELRIVDIPW